MNFIALTVILCGFAISDDFSFKLNKEIDIPQPEASVVNEEEKFDPSLPTTEPPDSVKYLIKSDFQTSKGINTGMNDFDINSYQEIKYLDIVIKNAKEQNFDVELVLSIIKKESNFNPKAKSYVGAVGLMQLMPDTAKWLGLKNTSKLYDPDINIKYGIKYLRYLFSTISPEYDVSNLSKDDINKNEFLKPIAAYNAGPGNVKKYDKPPHNGIPPFPETKDYVKKVPFYFIKFKELNIPK